MMPYGVADQILVDTGSVNGLLSDGSKQLLVD